MAQLLPKALRYLGIRRSPGATEPRLASKLDLELQDALNEVAGFASAAPSRARPETADLSENLQAFARAEPYIREGILGFVREAAANQPAGARVLDIGAGEAPYRELFRHVTYTTTDWEKSVHPGAAAVDTVASAEDLPFADESFDAAIMTEVLEHIADPGSALLEVGRVLRPDGRLYLTVPFVWPLHEMPHDHYRYTPSSLARLLDLSGFHDHVVSPHGNYFLVLAQLLWDAPGLIGAADDGLDDQRQAVGLAMRRISQVFAPLAHLDRDPTLPLGFSVVACKTSNPR